LAAKHRGPKPRPRLEGYRKALAGAPDWDAYLRRNSGLPGPRANLELAQAAAESASPARIRRWCAISPEHGSDDEYLAFCGVIGLGILAARGSKPALGRLGLFASDPRWRIREAVALGLQLVGDRDWDQLLRTARSWAAKRHASHARRSRGPGRAEAAPAVLPGQTGACDLGPDYPDRGAHACGEAR
jgi:hypothetical protein